MSFISWLILILACAWILAYFRTKFILWTVSFAILIVLWITLQQPSILAALFVIVIFLVIFLPFNLTGLRREYVSKHILKIFRKMLPPMSQTEREALEAGTVWWDGELFSGRPNWKKLLAYKKPELTDEEKAFLEGPVNDLCKLLDDWEITNKLQDLSPDAWDFIKTKGFFGIIIPKKYGGLGFSAYAHSTIVMKIASRSVAAAVTVMVPNSLGPAELLQHYGTEDQKDYYLPRLAKGEDVPCFALTGPEAGSDATSIPDSGIVCRAPFEGKETLGIRLNWDKRYITLVPIATVLGLAFKLYDPEHLIGDKECLGITVALIPTHLPGVKIGERHSALDIPFLVGPTTGHDVFVPLDCIIGGVKRAGQGWRMLMENLSVGRSISLPAISTAAAKVTSFCMGSYARIRKQFKVPIGRFEGVEEPLARIGAYTYLMNAARKMTSVAVDSGERPSVVSAIVKYHLTERMRKLVNDGMDVGGGSAICLGPRNIIGRVYQSVPISITVEGANILTRTLIIFGQGAIRCHPYILKQMQAVSNPDQEAGLRQFDKALFGHLKFLLSNIAKSLFLGISDGRFSISPTKNPHAKKYYKKLNRMCAAFALSADIAMLVLGGKLKLKEKLSGRLADALSHLYLASTVLKYFKDEEYPSEDVPLLYWSCEEALYVIQESLNAFMNNFPNRPVAWMLKRIIFPLGRTYQGPSDRLGHLIAEMLQKPTETRERLCEGIYVPEGTEEKMGLLKVALAQVIAAEPAEKKLRDAIKKGLIEPSLVENQVDAALELGIIDEEEAKKVIDSENARKEVIKVDSFPFDYWVKQE